ncbi:MAG TPA: hypothetical protein VMY42_14795 [Thermoguttaceae bacterium]|nr:hypothetical protein [Thermoguttaceae bacterium]
MSLLGCLKPSFGLQMSLTLVHFLWQGLVIAMAATTAVTPDEDSPERILSRQLSQIEKELRAILPLHMTVTRAEAVELGAEAGLVLHASPRETDKAHPSLALFFWPESNATVCPYESRAGSHTFVRLGSSEAFSVYCAGPDGSLKSEIIKAFCTVTSRNRSDPYAGSWGEPVDGIRCGVRPVTASFAPDEDISVDVLYWNVSPGPITVCVFPDTFYTWVHLRVDTLAGTMALAGPHANGIYAPLKVSNFVTLEPGQTASFRQVIAHAEKPEVRLEPGRYFVRAEMNKINRMDRHLLGMEKFCEQHGIERPWCSGIESGRAPLTIVRSRAARSREFRSS